MKIKSLSFLLFIPLLASCGEAAHPVKVLTNLDITSTSSSTFLDVTADKINAMIEAENDFPLFIYSSDCGQCNTIMPLVENYIKQNQSTIYKFNVLNTTEFQKLIDKYPSRFYIGMTTPTFYMFSNDKVDTISNDNLTTQTNVDRVLNQYLLKSKTYTCIDNVGYTTFNNLEEEKLYLIIDREVSGNNGFWSMVIEEYAYKSTKNTLLIDYKIISNELKTTLSTEYTTYENRVIIKNTTSTTNIDFNVNPSEAMEAVYNFYGINF